MKRLILISMLLCVCVLCPAQTPLKPDTTINEKLILENRNPSKHFIRLRKLRQSVKTAYVPTRLPCSRTKPKHNISLPIAMRAVYKINIPHLK